MTRDKIIRMAREAGFADGVAEIVGLEGFANFAALVAAAEREVCIDAMMQTTAIAVDAAMALQREACAKLCLETEPFYGVMFANAIRARGNT